MRRLGLFAAAALAPAGVVALLATDRWTMPLAGALLVRQGLLADVLFFVAKLLTLAFLIYGCALVVAIVWLWGGTQGPRAGRTLLFASLAQVITTELLKTVFGRERPLGGSVAGAFHGPTLNLDWRAFPSGHAAWSFAAASVLSAYYPRYRGLFYVLASAVSLSRFFVGSHHLSDIFAGACIGAAIGAAFVARFPPEQSGAVGQSGGPHG